MKNLNLILKNKWHLHVPIGNVLMAGLLFLASNSESLRYLEQVLVSAGFLYFGCWLFEFWQDTKLPEGEKQSNKTFYGDVFAGLIGGAICFLTNIYFHLSENYILQIIVTVLLLLIGGGLEIYRRKNKV